MKLLINRSGRRLGFECFIFLYCVRWGGQYTYSSVVCPVTSASEPFSHGLILIVWLPAGTICVPDRAQVVWLVCQMDYIGERPRVSDRVRQWRRVELSDTDTKFRWTIIIAINTKYNFGLIDNEQCPVQTRLSSGIATKNNCNNKLIKL